MYSYEKWEAFFYIKVKFDARLQEVSTNINLNQEAECKKIEKSIEKELQVESENMIKEVTKYKCGWVRIWR